MNESVYNNTDDNRRSQTWKVSNLDILKNSFERLKFTVADIDSSLDVLTPLRTLAKKDNSYVKLEQNEEASLNESISDYKQSVCRIEGYIKEETDRLSRLSEEERDSNYERDWREFVQTFEKYVRSNQHKLG